MVGVDQPPRQPTGLPRTIKKILWEYQNQLNTVLLPYLKPMLNALSSVLIISEHLKIIVSTCTSTVFLALFIT